MNARIEYIDYFKGGAILLVLLHHCGILPSYILAFHMPLFFFISGLLYGNKKDFGSFEIFVKKRFDRLIIPYFAFEILSLLLASVLHYSFPFLGFDPVYKIDWVFALRNIILCLDTPEYIGVTNRLWFFPALFVSDIIFYWVVKVFNRQSNRGARTYIILFSGFVFLSFLLSKTIENMDNVFVFSTLLNPARLPFAIDIAVTGVAYIILGFSASTFVVYLYRQKKLVQIPLICTSLITLYLSVKYNSDLFLMFINSYGNYFVSSVGAISGILLFITLIFVMTPILPKKSLVFLGKNTLIFFPIHLYVISLYDKIIPFTSAWFNNYYLEVTVKISVVFVLSLVLIWFVNRYMKLLTGTLPVFSRTL